MKKDLRVQYPLWQMAFIVLFGVLAFGVTGASTEFIRTEDELSYSMELAAIESFSVFGTALITFVLIIIFSLKISKHNKQHPSQKLSMWQIRPIEFLEQDEGMTHITRRASQKVYTFFVWTLPFLAVLYMIFEMPRFWMILGILFLALMQYLIYYLEVRKHLQEDDE